MLCNLLHAKASIFLDCRADHRPSRIFANSVLISFWFIAISRAAFCRVLASVCEAKLRLCVWADKKFKYIR